MSRIVYYMSNEDYHAHPAHGSTKLKRWLHSPLDAMTPVAKTDAMRRGTLIHEALEDVQAFVKRYTLPPTREQYADAVQAIAAALPDKLADLRALVDVTRAPCKARSRDELAESVALYVIAQCQVGETISLDDWVNVALARAATLSHPAVAATLDASKQRVAEASIIWTDERTGIECKCRPDVLCLDTGTILDWKSAADPSPRAFDKAAGSMLYHLSAAHYVDGIARHFGVSHGDLQFAFVVTPSALATPERVTVRTVDEDTIARGLALRDKALDRVAEYRLRKEQGTAWDGYAEAPLPLSVPQWADRI